MSMKLLISLVSVVSIALGACAAPAVRTSAYLGELGNSVRDSSALFLLGWYDGANRPIEIADYTSLGFNATVPYTSSASVESIKSFLRAASESGIRSFLQIPKRILKDEDIAVLDVYIDTFLDEPFYGWYLADEPELNRDLPKDRLRYAAERIRAEDGRPIFIMLYRPEAILEFSEFCDLTGINYYPAFKWTFPFLYLGESFITRVRRAAAAAAVENKRFVLALQAYGRAPDGSDQFMRRLPTDRETAYMFWASLSERPSGVLYWARYRTDPRWVDETLRPVVGAFRELFPDRLAYWDVPGAEGKGVVSLTGLHDGTGVAYVLVVNHGFPARNVDLRSFSATGSIRLPGLTDYQELRPGVIRLRGHSAAVFKLRDGE